MNIDNAINAVDMRVDAISETINSMALRKLAIKSHTQDPLRSKMLAAVEKLAHHAYIEVASAIEICEEYLNVLDVSDKSEYMSSQKETLIQLKAVLAEEYNIKE